MVELPVKPESVDTMKSYLKEILPDTRSFDGCEVLTVERNVGDPNRMVIVERWNSRPQYEKYLEWRTERGDLEKLTSMLAEEPSIRYFETVGL